jgi:ATP-dependent Lhr-like helicase
MITPPSRRKAPLRPAGRWSILRGAEIPTAPADNLTELVARQLLRRTGVVFRRTILREKLPVTWASLMRVYRRLELKGEIRGGRFVAGFSGEQFALPEAVELLRHVKRQPPRNPVSVISADPLNFQGILTPDERVAPTTRREVLVG